MKKDNIYPLSIKIFSTILIFILDELTSFEIKSNEMLKTY